MTCLGKNRQSPVRRERKSKLAAPILVDEVCRSYDRAAAAYAEHLSSELDDKPLDRHLLDRFAEATRGRGRVADLGCGPGHITRYLHDREVEVVGVDLSRRMIECARRQHPGLQFCVGDMRRLVLPDAGLAGVVAFYSIVHFTARELAPVLAQIRKAVAPGGVALFAFHIGNDVVHLDELFGVPVSLDFHFHLPSNVIWALDGAGFAVTEHTERSPYPGAEYPSRRCYLFAHAI